MSSPAISIDEFGLCTWTNPATPPYQWVIEQRGSDKLSYYKQTYVINGTDESFDASANWLYKGLYVVLFGVDDQDNLILTPSISSTVLIY